MTGRPIETSQDIIQPPHVWRGEHYESILRAWFFAASLIALFGVVVFGFAAAWLLLISLGVALATQFALQAYTPGPRHIRRWESALIGLCFGLTLPPGAQPHVAVIGVLLAVLIGQGVFARVGRPIWQPALIGRVLVGFLFMSQFTDGPQGGASAILAPGRLLFGNIADATSVDMASYRGWEATRPLAGRFAHARSQRAESAADSTHQLIPVDTITDLEVPDDDRVEFAPNRDGSAQQDASAPAGPPTRRQASRSQRLDDLLPDALAMPRCARVLRDFSEGRVDPDQGRYFTPLLRDALPPWRDTLLGVVPGGIGETSTFAIIIAGFYLIYRGHLRWQVPAMVLLSAAAAAAFFPVELARTGEYHWLPGLHMENGRAVGIAYVLYHLTAGQLVIGAFLLAGDLVTSPLRIQGQVTYAAGVGIITIFLRLYGIIEAECYWAILIMNTLVPWIDRRLPRPILGIVPSPQ